jgi:LacI family transcriptional regulator
MTRYRVTTPTSSEVAQRAGVSRTTVSFVLNDSPNKGISEETRKRVLEAAQELGYTPNAAARSLKGGGTGTVAVVIARSEHLHVDAFLPRLLSTVNESFQLQGYRVLIEAAEGPEGEFLNLVRSKRIDGLIVANVRERDRLLVKQLSEEGFPVVMPGNGLERFNTRHTDVDDSWAAQRGVEHLLKLGHRRIAHIGFGSEAYQNVQSRRVGYERALREAGISPDPALVTNADISARSGQVAMQRLLDTGVDFSALFAGNDTIALGAMKALRLAGRRLPDDVAIVGYDDIPLADFAHPPLTTLRSDPVLQGQEAVDQLLALMGGKAPHVSSDAYEVSLVVRESCGTARSNFS